MFATKATSIVTIRTVRPVVRRTFVSKSAVRDPGLQWTSVRSHPKTVPGPTAPIPGRGAQIQALQQYDGSSRSSTLNQDDTTAKTNCFDVLVVGGGATGAGVALDAASRGWKVALVERGDFASETSSRSTKLIWAGIKYMGSAVAGLCRWRTLQNPVGAAQDFYHEMLMVYHCHVERRYMTDVQPHLCQWIPLAVPFYKWHLFDKPPLKEPLFGIFPLLAPLTFRFYDGLSGFSCPASYTVWSKQRVTQMFPQLKTENLKYVSVFYEARHNDSRTNLAIALSAAAHGAVVANYVEVTKLITPSSVEDDDDQNDKSSAVPKVTEAHVVDRTTGKEWTIRAKHVVLAGGPFTDGLRQLESSSSSSSSSKKEEKAFRPAVRAASGTHIILPPGIVPDHLGLLDYQTSDGRFLFVLPWLGHTLVGTTDQKCPAETLPAVPEDEIQWLVDETSRYLNTPVHRSQVTSAWRGWRPLASDPHASGGPVVSRDHVISRDPDTGLWFIAGGKWTTWRQMAQDVVDRVAATMTTTGSQQQQQQTSCQTLTLPLHGRDGFHENLLPQVRERYPQLEADVAAHLVETYGGLVWTVLDGCDKDTPRRLVPGFPYVDVEVSFACREYACTVEDVVSRRTRLAFLDRAAALEAIPAVADLMATELGWSRSVKNGQIKAARQYVASYGGSTAAEESSSSPK